MNTSVATSSPPSGNRRWLPYGLATCAVIAACLLITAAGAWWYNQRRAQADSQPRIEYVLDASPRMAQPAEGGTRLDVTRAVLAEVIRPSETTLAAGLRVFGTGAQTDACRDTHLIVPLAQDSQAAIADGLGQLQVGPGPGAALAQAMIAAIRDLSPAQGPRTMVVVTGGADSCNAEAGELVAAEAEHAGVKLQLFVIGYQVSDAEADALKSLAEDGAGGTYLTALDSAALKNILEAIQTSAENSLVLPKADAVETVITAARQAAPPVTATSEPPTVSPPTSIPPPTQPPKPTAVPTLALAAGLWSGATSQGWPLRFEVGPTGQVRYWHLERPCGASGDDLKVEWPISELQRTADTATTTQAYDQTITLTSGSINVHVTTTLTVQFLSETTATGEFKYNVEPDPGNEVVCSFFNTADTFAANPQ